MKLEEAKAAYPGEWIAFRELEEGENPEGKVELHERNREEFDRKLHELGLVDVYVTFSGPLVPEGYVTLL